MFEAFHFLHPQWLWALLPLPLLLWRLGRRETGLAPWRGVIQPHLLPYLVITGRRSPLPLVLLGLGWTLAVLALANPAWDRQPTPLLKSRDARVIVLDLSRSMTTQDLTPSRLARARFKVAESLARNRDGQNALVVFAGDAFVVAPLTEDGATITALLAALEPGIMPVQGSRADLGLKKAGELLTQAGVSQGEVLLIADEADGRAEAAARALRAGGYRVSVLGVGTTEGAPLPDDRGGFLQGADGKPLVTTLVEPPLSAVAAAGGGRYAKISPSDEDIQRLLPPATNRIGNPTEASGLEGERWNERGPLLVLLLLPLGALAFRRGWLVALATLTLGGLPTPETVHAFGWDDLWQRPDQQAAAALQAGDAARAAQVARDPMQQGAALYRSGDLSQALERFSQGASADANYNRGNALARLGQYPEAIAAYDEALAQDPDMEDATYNKAQVEALLKRRAEQQHPSQGSQTQPQTTGEQSSDASSQQGDTSHSKPGGDQSQGNTPNPTEADNPDGGHRSSEGEQGERPQTGSAQSPTDQSAENQHSQQAQGASAAESQPASTDARPTGVPDGQRAPPAEQASLEVQSASADPSQSGEGNQVPNTPQAKEPPATGKPPEGQVSPAEADPLDTEQRQAIDQWLRRIPDDPGGLLRRKLLYQYRERPSQATAAGEKPW